MESKNEVGVTFLHLRFIGKILAGFTHEIKNHLAIVKESAGLRGDMIQLGKSTQDDSGQYLEIVQSIEEQIEKSTTHFTYLNRLSHRMDTPLSTFSVNDSIEELAALLQRFANQKKIMIEKDLQKDLAPVHSNPSMLQFLVFTFLEEMLTELDKNSRISIKTEGANNAVAIRITPEGNFVEGASGTGPMLFEIGDAVIKQLGGTLSRETGKGVVILLPLRTAYA
ncbi:MAG: HAMP domain-containing histidine kinase [Nitrospirales bacterium]|nr:MAG: HAMP domain-containing histidine kinase [Nitrospirales bacterium]